MLAPFKTFDEKEKADYFKYIDETIVVLAKDNPETNIIVVLFPPTTLERARLMRFDQARLKSEREVARHLLSTGYKNIKVYGFDNYDEFGHIEDYGDLRHYDGKINSYILTYMSQGKGELTLDNLDKFFDEAWAKAKKIDYDYYYKRAQTALTEFAKKK